ncbi:MAG TPA: hypothetical protein VGI39_01660 [Polyangiaceae bacterium]|jgi:hypothetical protein
MLRISRSAQALLASSTLLLALAAPRHARADVLPITSCGPTAKAGDSCTTAGDGTEDGVCAESQCQSSHPLPDGGFSTSSYPCLLCELADAGPSDAGHDASPAPPEDAGPTPPDTGDAGNADAGGSDSANRLASSSSCTAGSVGSGGGAGTFLALGALGVTLSLARSRRRRSA